MYGLVNQAVEGMVRGQFDDGTWERIKQRAGVEVEVWQSNEGYPDKVTYDLVGAAVEELGMPVEDILKAFGQYWVLETAQKGYGAMMRAGGRDFESFIRNLPNFHSRVSLVFPKLQPPEFQVTDGEDGTLVLEYYSHRPGLQAFVIGLVEGLGKMYETPVECRYLKGREEGLDHDEFFIRWDRNAA